jgi:hypothetical protein
MITPSRACFCSTASPANAVAQTAVTQMPATLIAFDTIHLSQKVSKALQGSRVMIQVK